MKATDDELLLVAAYCGVDLHEEEGLDLEFCEWQHTHISNHSVFLGVSWFRETEKTCTTMTPNTGALIWRWFLVAWGGYN